MSVWQLETSTDLTNRPNLTQSTTTSVGFSKSQLEVADTARACFLLSCCRISSFILLFGRSMVWEEVEVVQREKRYELVLHGAYISARIGESGLDAAIFKLINLNFLQISQTELKEVPEALGELTNLRTLDLHQNKLTRLPSSFGKLTELKFCDISNNCLKEISEELGELTNLHTLNLSCNTITALPSFNKLVHLAKFDCSHNKLTKLPDGIHQLQSLSELRALNNEIEYISEDISRNVALKVLDLSGNKLKTLPSELAECHKLKDLTLIDNPISDNRLNKLIKQCSTKSVLDYVRNMAGKGKGRKGKKKNSKSAGEESAEDLQHVVRVERSEQYKVCTKANVAEVRPYIVCVVAKKIDLSQPEIFKKFINMQVSLIMLYFFDFTSSQRMTMGRSRKDLHPPHRGNL